MKDTLLERIKIGRETKTRQITEDYMKDYASKMPIFLLHGGPGYGKSFLVTRIREMIQSLDLNSLVMAFSGTAASQFKNDKTIHSTCGWNIKKNMKKFSTISNNTMPTKVALVGSESSLIIIDECSMIGPQWVANNSNAMKQIIKSKVNDWNYKEPDDTFMSNTSINFINHTPFGSLLSILSGDLFQLPCMNDGTIYSEVVEYMLNPQNILYNDPTSPLVIGLNILINNLVYLPLTEQVRCAEDPIHTEILNALRKTNVRFPVTQDILTTLRGRQLAHDRIIGDPRFLFATEFVPTNHERWDINVNER